MRVLRDRLQPLVFLALVLAIPTGCHPSFQPASPTDEVIDFTGRNGRYTRSAFLSDSRGWVFFSVYLPPGWTPQGTETYPLIFFLHGQSGDEYYFPRVVDAGELSRWIEEGELPPFVAIAPRGADQRNTVQWYQRANEIMLTSEEDGELRAYARENFRAGIEPGTVSVHGHSRGSTGALFFAMTHSEKFASAVVNAFVSDYALEDRQRDANENRECVLESGISLRIIIGTEDQYVVEVGRIATPAMHEHLQELGIPHEYEILEGVDHSLRAIWNYRRADGRKNGLYELQFHARAWGR